jgi:CRP-like cAMP-binding protein
LASLNFSQIRIDRALNSSKGSDDFNLSREQIDFLEMFFNGATLEQAVRRHFERGVFVNFASLRSLLEFLVEEKLILNPSFTNYFESLEKPQKGVLARMVESVFGADESGRDLKKEISDLPFFRSLKPQQLKTFLKNANVLEAPARVAICEAGRTERNLFVLIEGQADVISVSGERLAVLGAGSIFGEVGFFLGEPRTASVVTSKKSLILKIRYVPEVFAGLTKAGMAQELQSRFWVVQALQNSKIFRDIPQDCFDTLIFAGNIRKFPPNQWIFKEGDKGDTCYIIVRGKVVVSKQNTALRELSPGDCFGEIALTMTAGRRTASIHNLAEMLALEIPAPKFYSLLAENFMLACQIEKLALQRIRDDQKHQTIQT